MGAYATVLDVYRLALSAQAFVTRPRPIDPRAGDSLDPATGIFSLIGHGYGGDDRVRLVTVGSGAVPGGAAAGLPYTVIPLDYWRFQITLGAGPILFSDAGTGAWGIQLDPEVRLRAHLVDAAARIDECLTAQAPPIERDPITGLYPAVLVGMNARMAARAAVTSLQVENPAFKVPIDRLMAQEKADEVMLMAWKDGRPILPAVTDQTSTPDDAPRAGNAGVASLGVDLAWVTGAM